VLEDEHERIVPLVRDFLARSTPASGNEQTRAEA
jgi:hypothetical protein